ncbi:helix-turn-helix domain-containing protein [Sulfurisoma sediminicola]|uniref:HTH-type transcriptional regulator/antitoxin HigA n=2 Tax=Sulfurisoma sediminicola TaxID=1381557 RepID=A0A497XN52_9PROT|nr:transcriptional regulator [Sulfurisoma sediminicola]RLJ67659.1 HTH-type transcriptional regulator/antitoxin HigA [Sulfurisoma sediminicola]
MNMNDISAHWVALHEQLGLGAPVANKAQYRRLLACVEALMEDYDDRAGNPLGGLLLLLAERIREYEDRVHPWPDTTTPASLLAFLMEQHGLRQSDLPEVGSQSVVSAVLSGKRDLNLRQIKALAARFHVPMEALAG